MTQWGLDTLFNPAKRHMDEEKQRLQSTREEIGDSSGGKRIDLESGKVTIRREARAEAAEVAQADDEGVLEEAEHVDAEHEDVEPVEAAQDGAAQVEAQYAEAQQAEAQAPEGRDPEDPSRS